MAEIASAFLTIAPSARGFQSKLDSQIGGDIDKSGKKAGLSFGKVFAGAAALGIGAKAFSFLGDSLGEAREASVIGARTANVIKEMGNAANISANGVANLAGRISAKTGIDDEAIQSGQNLLLTFGNIRNEAGKGNKIFSQTSQLMVDMSAAMGTDAKSAALQLGKALNDPTKGVTALTRSGVSFTAQQKAQIATLQESGNILGAQKVILGEVSKQFGGAAESMATPADRAKVAIGNLKETIGTALLPTVDSAATKFTGFVNGMQTGEGAGGRFASVLKSVASNFGTIAPVLGVVVTGMAAYKVASFAAGAAAAIQAAGTRAATGATWSLNAALRANPIGLVVTAVTLLAAGLVVAYKKSDTFRGIVDKVAGVIKGNVLPVVSRFAGILAGAVVSAVSAVIGVVGKIIGTMVNLGAAVIDRIQDFAKFTSGVKEKFGAALDFVKDIPGKVTGVFSGAATLLYNAGSQLMSGLASGIRNKINDAINEVKAGLSKIRDLLPGSPIKAGPLKPWNDGRPGVLLMDMLAKGITKGGKKAEEAMRKQLDRLKTRLGGLKDQFASLSQSVATAFNKDVFGGTLADMFAGLSGNNANLKTLIGSFQTLKDAGASTAFLSSLFQSGNSEVALGLAGSSTADIKAASALFDDNAALATQLGNTVAGNQFGEAIGGVRDEIRELRKDLNRGLKESAARSGYVMGSVINDTATRGQRDKKNGARRR